MAENGTINGYYSFHTEGVRERDKGSFGSVLKSVSQFNHRDKSHSLARHLYQDLRTDWPFYAEEERATLKRYEQGAFHDVECSLVRSQLVASPMLESMVIIMPDRTHFGNRILRTSCEVSHCRRMLCCWLVTAGSAVFGMGFCGTDLRKMSAGVTNLNNAMSIFILCSAVFVCVHVCVSLWHWPIKDVSRCH